MADQKPTTHDSALGWAILGIIGLVIFFLFWHFYQYEVKNVFRWLRWSEMKLMSMVLSDDYTVNWGGEPYGYRIWLNDLGRATPQQLDGHYDAVAGVGLQPLKFVFMGILMVMAIWAYRRGPGTQFKRKLDLDGLMRVQAATFPVIAPLIHFDPGKQPPRPPGSPVPAELPPFAEALGPEEWLSYNRAAIPDGRADESDLYLSFARQLGPRWQGPQKLSPARQILLAAFCLKAVRKRGEADDMLGRAAMCWSKDHGLQLSKDRSLLGDARKVLRNEKLAGNTLKVCNQHAFEATALMRALQHARSEGGVLAPAQFVWMRAFDRALWYPLNNLGRQAFHMEALGAMTHFKAEKLVRRPIPKPKLDDAVRSIADYVRSARMRPLPQLDYAKAKTRRGILKPANLFRRGRKKK